MNDMEHKYSIIAHLLANILLFNYQYNLVLKFNIKSVTFKPESRILRRKSTNSDKSSLRWKKRTVFILTVANASLKAALCLKSTDENFFSDNWLLNILNSCYSIKRENFYFKNWIKRQVSCWILIKIKTFNPWLNRFIFICSL